ncbi:coxsackievirus and adenovirus receptor homolog [Trematomus bernacchii]|uniref:coxsackievirus and adenovirus receptor homolog n=1 Tax=Trematomus bernacchii TaxID=40690 RepID=UPI00146F5125|nr:coxsackievirus and adenovirus receptor homolog [Trematomus bernacchii]
MATLISAQHVFMFLWIIGSVAAEAFEAKPGEDVTLPCNSHTDAAVTKLVWSRPELKGQYVVFFRNNMADENNQDQRYRGRVELKDPEMKNGDASVVLKNVTVNDTGTYQCRVTIPTMPKELLRSVLLIVSKGPTKEEFEEKHRRKVGLGVGLGVGCLVVVVVGFALGRFVFLKSQSGPL